MSDRKPNYQLRFEISALFAIVFLVVALMRGCEITSLESEIELLEIELDNCYHEAYEEGYDAGYTQGYDAAAESLPLRADTILHYCELDDMNTDDILSHLEDIAGERYWSNEEVYNIFIYAFQRGYSNRANGIWDDMTEEFIDGYEFSQNDIEEYSVFEWE